MNDDQISEVMRLASLYATARVIKHRTRIGDITTVTPEQAADRAAKAEQELSDYLKTIP
jgi:translation initiation factor 2B subunit (eIF-2B alpha/beta/delta family)